MDKYNLQHFYLMSVACLFTYTSFTSSNMHIKILKNSNYFVSEPKKINDILHFINNQNQLVISINTEVLLSNKQEIIKEIYDETNYDKKLGIPLFERNIYNEFKKLRNKVIDLINIYNTVENIIFTGSGMSGGLSLLLSLYSSIYFKNKIIQCYTFGMPKICNYVVKQLSDMYLSLHYHILLDIDKYVHSPCFYFNYISNIITLTKKNNHYHIQNSYCKPFICYLYCNYNPISIEKYCEYLFHILELHLSKEEIDNKILINQIKTESLIGLRRNS
jgi:hypothetical protein